MPAKLRLYLIGLAMGLADLIPGISGGTVAFFAGIYEEWLQCIKTLQFHSLRSIAWPFLLPLGAGMATAILLFSKAMAFLLLHYQAPLFALFFGLIAASTISCARKIKTKKPQHFMALALGACISFGLTLLPPSLLFGSHFLGLMVAGFLATGAMLLPGISGSYLLQVLGVYPLVIVALSDFTAPNSLKVLVAMSLGIALGFILFSRLISALMAHFSQVTLCVLVGFMGGGLKALWPFGLHQFVLPFLFLIAGFFLAISLEIKMKRWQQERGVLN